jgi:hypothetical protein
MKKPAVAIAVFFKKLLLELTEEALVSCSVIQ